MSSYQLFNKGYQMIYGWDESHQTYFIQVLEHNGPYATELFSTGISYKENENIGIAIKKMSEWLKRQAHQKDILNFATLLIQSANEIFESIEYEVETEKAYRNSFMRQLLSQGVLR